MITTNDGSETNYLRVSDYSLMAFAKQSADIILHKLAYFVYFGQLGYFQDYRHRYIQRSEAADLAEVVSKLQEYWRATEIPHRNSLSELTGGLIGNIAFIHRDFQSI